MPEESHMVSASPGWSTHRSLVAFFVSTYAISWVLWVPMAAYSQGWLPVQISPFLGIIVGGAAPSLAAILLTGIESGRTGIRALLGRLLRWRVAVRWYAFVLFAPAILMLVAVALHILLGGTAPELANISWGAVLPLFLLTLVFGGPLGEEIGWRGYALPRLQDGHSAVLASLVVGFFWGMWHLPLFWVPESLQSGIPITWYLVSILADAILYTWIYNHTKGSLLIACLLHAAINTWAKVILLPATASDLRPLLLTFGLEWILVIVVILWAGPSRLSRQLAVRGEAIAKVSKDPAASGE